MPPLVGGSDQANRGLEHHLVGATSSILAYASEQRLLTTDSTLVGAVKVPLL